MAKYIRECENGTVKHVLTFRGKDFEFSMVPDEGRAVADNRCFSVQLSEEFPDISERTLQEEIEVDILDCVSDDELLDILQELEQLE